MNRHEDINPNDPLFLVSRDFDGDLSAAEKARLDALLANSAVLRSEAGAIRAVSSLMAARREDEARVDWLNYEKLVVARVAETEEDSTEIDEFLRSWGSKQPVYNERAYVGEVLNRMAAPKRRQASWRLITRIGAPLAAAAAVVIAVTATWQTPVSVVSLSPVSVVQIGPEIVEQVGAVSVVSFSRTEQRAGQVEETVSFGYMTLGSSPIPQAEEAPL